MDQVIWGMLTLARQWLRPRYNARLRFLEAQVAMLRARVDGNRIIPTPEEREELLRLGAQFDHEIDEVMHVVVPETYKKWLRERRGPRRPPRRVGRPRIARAIRLLVLRIARENSSWGYRRVGGELKKLGIHIGESTVRKILVEDGDGPRTDRPAEQESIAWQRFIAANMESMVACDFFTKRIYTLRGNFTAYVLVFIHLESRRVFCCPATYHPTGRWMVQQGRNVSMWIEDEGINARFLIRDRDAKYSFAFDEFWRSADMKIVRTPVHAPKANAYAESFIGTLKRECLNHFACFGRDQLDYILGKWIHHYNTERPHRGKGKGNVVLDVNFRASPVGRIRCKRELGGLIKHYYRDAA